jgi:hypothetical protein
MRNSNGFGFNYTVLLHPSKGWPIGFGMPGRFGSGQVDVKNRIVFLILICRLGNESHHNWYLSLSSGIFL